MWIRSSLQETLQGTWKEQSVSGTAESSCLSLSCPQMCPRCYTRCDNPTGYYRSSCKNPDIFWGVKLWRDLWNYKSMLLFLLEVFEMIFTCHTRTFQGWMFSLAVKTSASRSTVPQLDICFCFWLQLPLIEDAGRRWWWLKHWPSVTHMGDLGWSSLLLAFILVAQVWLGSEPENERSLWLSNKESWK